ncbi:unnamed protein product [Caenorhabditis nigoni]
MPNTTTSESVMNESPNIHIFENDFNGLTRLQKVILELQNIAVNHVTTKILITYVVTVGPLAICLICCMCSYLMAFTRNLRAHAGSPLFPLIAYSYRNIKYLYIMFFVFGICFGISMSMGVKGLVEQLTTVVMYYLVSIMVYITRQILLFIATIFQFCISEEPKSHSEYCVVTHTKSIGLVKMILGAICFASYLFNFETTVAFTPFFGIDMFLVPVVVQITEIRASPNVVIPTEIQLEPLIV